MTDMELTGLGWSAHFARQVTREEMALCARVARVHRDAVEVLGVGGLRRLLPPKTGSGSVAVGDWVVADETRVTRRLAPAGELARRAAGTAAETQLIAANVDTLGIVTSCNADFNVARLERYVALAASAGALPLVILTKADLCEDPRAYRRQAEAISPLVTAIDIDARDAAEIARLAPWAREGRTLALVGSSGVGKTTIRNGLTGDAEATQGIREDDAKGRHTTTARDLRPTLHGGWIIDTPGMRALRLTGAAEGIEAVFPEIEELAAGCRFGDCTHAGEPGCAVEAAIGDGRLDPARLARWRKLQREDARNSESIAEARARERSFSKHVGRAMMDKQGRRGD